MGESVSVVCPWCGETVELWVEPDTQGSMIQDCDVCCRPWRLQVAWDQATNRCSVVVERS